MAIIDFLKKDEATSLSIEMLQQDDARTQMIGVQILHHKMTNGVYNEELRNQLMALIKTKTYSRGVFQKICMCVAQLAILGVDFWTNSISDIIEFSQEGSQIACFAGLNILKSISASV